MPKRSNLNMFSFLAALQFTIAIMVILKVCELTSVPETPGEAMGYTSARHCVNLKAIFCIALFAILTNLVLTQNLYTSLLDDTRNALMSYSSGSSSLLTVKPASTHYIPRPARPVSKSRFTGGWGSRLYVSLVFSLADSHFRCAFVDCPYLRGFQTLKTCHMRLVISRLTNNQ